MATEGLKASAGSGPACCEGITDEQRFAQLDDVLKRVAETRRKAGVEK